MSALAAMLSIFAAATPAPVTLTVHYAGASGGAHVAHLRCRGDRARADGFLRTAGAATACRRARRLAAFLARRPDPKRICTLIYGGPQRARVAGAIGTRHIDRRFRRTNGCEINDWQRAVPLVPRAAANVTP